MTIFSLDIPTVYMLTGVGGVGGAAILLWLRGDHRDSGPAMTLLAIAVFGIAVGFICFALRKDLFQWIAPTLGYAGFGVAAAFVWLGSAYLLEARPHPRVAAAAIALFLAALSVLHEPTAARSLVRIVLSSVFVMVFLILAVRDAGRSKWLGRLRSVRLMRGMLLLYTALIGMRMVLFATSTIPILADGTADPGNLRLFFAAIFASMPFAITVSALGVSHSLLAARLRRLATTDDLTGLVSRRSLAESGQRLLERQDEIGCIALMMIDLDNFKEINDRHGHSAGDELLRHVAGVLRQALRSDSLIVRYGGDEFCALVPVPGEAAAFVVAERLRAVMESTPLVHGAHRIGTTMSIGVTVHRPGRTLKQLLDEADQRAYQAKAQGRNRVVADDALMPS